MLLCLCSLHCRLNAAGKASDAAASPRLPLHKYDYRNQEPVTVCDHTCNNSFGKIISSKVNSA
jgi:hypothetical protein